MTQVNAKNTFALIAATAFSVGLASPAIAQSTMSTATAPAFQSSTNAMTGEEQWRTLANGCSYSRAQAPGYEPTWHLIVNPHHLDQPSRNSKCATILKGS